jgi:Arylsulfatase A and related enzymes
VVILVDTLRADAVDDARTPAIDGIADDGQVVHSAWAPGTWTVPSVISLFTGMPVREHGWDLPTGRIGRYPPVPAVPTLAEVLHQAGIETRGWTSNPYLDAKLGFGRGFDSWNRSADPQIPKQFARDVASWGDGRRHFAWLHFIGPHSPLDPSPEARQRWDLADTWFTHHGGLGVGYPRRGEPMGVRAAYPKAYRAVIEDTDVRVGAVLDALAPYRDDTLVVFVSDHGELLGEHHQFGHGHWVWQPLIHVPFIVSGPGAPRLPDPVSTAALPDVVTTAMGIAHNWVTTLDPPTELVTQREGRLAVSPDGRYTGVWDQDGKLSVYDLQADPGELVPLSDDHGVRAARRAWEHRVPAGKPAGLQVKLDDQTVQALQQIGYLGGK